MPERDGALIVRAHLEAAAESRAQIERLEGVIRNLRWALIASGHVPSCPVVHGTSMECDPDSKCKFAVQQRIAWHQTDAGLVAEAIVFLKEILPFTVRTSYLTPEGHTSYCAVCEYWLDGSKGQHYSECPVPKIREWLEQQGVVGS